MAPMVAALRRHLRPMDWRCGAAAGALCNLLRLGKAAAEALGGGGAWGGFGSAEGLVGRCSAGPRGVVTGGPEGIWGLADLLGYSQGRSSA